MAAIAAIMLVVAIGATQGVKVECHKSLQQVEFGWPFTWLVQDLEALDPPAFPARLTAKSFMENPTSITWAAFGVDVVLLGAFQFLLLTVVLRVNLINGEPDRRSSRLSTGPSG